MKNTFNKTVYSVLALALLVSVALPVLADTTNNNAKQNRSAQKTALRVCNQAYASAIKAANQAYVKAVKAANDVYRAAVQKAAADLKIALAAAKDKTTKVAARQAYKDAVKVAKDQKTVDMKKARENMQTAKKAALDTRENCKAAIK